MAGGKRSYISHPVPAREAAVKRMNANLYNWQLHSRLDAARKHPQPISEIAKSLPVYGN